MFFLTRRRLARSVDLLNSALGKDVSRQAVAEIVEDYPRPTQLAETLRRVLAFEADPPAYNSVHPHREQRKYNHNCNFDASRRVSEALSLYFDPYEFTETAAYDNGFVEERTRELDEHGYSLIESRVPSADCDAIVEFLGQDHLVFREAVTNELHRGYSAENVEAATSNTCWLVDRFALLACPEIAALASDPNLVAVAQAFIGAPPILTQIVCWWSAPYSTSTEQVKTAAQQFHQDRDYIKFVKVFVHLTDVNDDNGPHVFIAGSNTDYATVSKNRLRASKRLSNEYLESVYDSQRFRTFTAPRGTVLFEDTSGFHRGTPVVSGHRLMLQFEFASTLYGSPQYRIDSIPTEHIPAELLQHARFLSDYRAGAN